MLIVFKLFQFVSTGFRAMTQATQLPIEVKSSKGLSKQMKRKGNRCGQMLVPAQNLLHCCPSIRYSLQFKLLRNIFKHTA